MKVAEEQEEEQEEEEEEEKSREPKLKSFNEAMQYMEDAVCFLDHRGCTMEGNQASQLLDSVNLLCAKSRNVIGSEKTTIIYRTKFKNVFFT